MSRCTMLEMRTRSSPWLLTIFFLAAGATLLPFASPLIMSVVLCVVGWPAQKWLERRFRIPTALAALLHAVSWLALIVLPASLILSTAASNLKPLVSAWKPGTPLIAPPVALGALPWVGHWLEARLRAIDINALVDYLVLHKDSVQSWLAALWLFIFHTAIAAMLVFALGLHGERVAIELDAAAVRLWGPEGPEVLTLARRSAQAIMGGLIGVGIGEGLLIGAAYAAASVPAWSVWMIATILLSPIPFGAAVVLLGAAGWLSLHGAWITAVILLVWGFAVIAAADLVFRPLVSSGAGEVSFLPMLLSILGGVRMFGLIGVIAGPLLLATASGIWSRWFAHAPRPARARRARRKKSNA